MPHSPSKTHPIFYDADQTRWRFSRWLFWSLGIFFTLVFGLVTVSIVWIRPTFPSLGLTTPGTPFGNHSIAPLQSALPLTETPQTPASSSSALSVPGSSESGTPTKVLGFYVDWDDNSLTSLKQNVHQLDTLVPEWLHLSDIQGGVSIDDQARQDETLQFIRSTRPNLPIIPLINNFSATTGDWDGAMLAEMLASKTARHTLVGNILHFVQSNGFQGISIDFESIPSQSQANMTLFMQELFATLHPLGLTVSQNIPLDDPDFQVESLSQFSDYLILMAYDEHSPGDARSGAIASQDWFTQALKACLQTLAANKYVIALGSYGYDWAGETTSGTDVTFQEAMATAKNAGSTITLDPKARNPTYDYTDSQKVVHHVWFLDAVSLFNEIQAVKSVGIPAGYALWRLGSEDPTIWPVLGGRETLGAPVAQAIETLQYGYDIDYEGSGEILRVTGAAQTGQRTLHFNPESGLISDEKITRFPTGYTISRFGGATPKKIALTFDDGPDATYTPQILAILKRYQIHATFFVIGANADFHPEILRDIVEQGNEVGNHTYTHPDITTISPERFRVELAAEERLLEGVLGRQTVLFRPPYAEDIEPTTPSEVAPLLTSSQLGYYTVSMHIDPSDWSRPGTDAIVQNVLGGATSGARNIVLLHDGGGNRDQTVAALPSIIEGLQQQGFELVTISDLLGVPRDTLMPPVSGRERVSATLDSIAFWSLSGFSHFLSLMFFLGIILGSARLIFIGVLALVQYFQTQRLRRTGALNLGENMPAVAVIIPAFNESAVILRTVSSILLSNYEKVSIVVVDDGSTDATLEKLQSQFRKHPRVRILTKPNAGKAAALNYGIAQADPQAEILVTLDADTIFRPDTIEKLIRRFQDERVGAVAGNAKVGNRLNLLTRWQALEYITSQNLDRRAFEIINCITVVPGAVGAWRRRVLLAAGGFSSDTLAEDADLTFSILRQGYRVAYDDEAIAYTEAPDTVHSFITQRFRWMLGTLQTAWKHRAVFLRPRYGALGVFALPNVFIFQVFFPMISPFMDLTVVTALGWAGWQKWQHPLDYSAGHDLHLLLWYYALFLLVDLLTAAVPFCLERKEQWSLLLFLPLQRFFYRQLMYYVAIKAVIFALKGRLAQWGSIRRKATVATPTDG